MNRKETKKKKLERIKSSELFVTLSIKFVIQFSCSVVSDSLRPHELLTVCQASLCITNSRSLLKLMSIQLGMPSSLLILCRPLPYCHQSFTASRPFPMSQFFTSGGQSIGVSPSASILPMRIED